jgi:ankyrin repeat protein
LGADLDARNHHGFTPLLTAISESRFDNAIHLIQLGADMFATDNMGRNALHFAGSTYAWVELLYRLVDAGVSLAASDHSGRTPMHYAVAYYATFENFLDLGGSIDSLDSDGRTPLHYATMFSTDHGLSTSNVAMVIVRSLVMRGANCAIRDRFGMTASDLARGIGEYEIARYLVQDCIARNGG